MALKKPESGKTTDAAAEAVAGHHDPAAEQRVVRIQRGQRAALGGRETPAVLHLTG